MSFANLTMYSSVLPSYDGKDMKEEEPDVINMSDPASKNQLMAFIAKYGN